MAAGSRPQAMTAVSTWAAAWAGVPDLRCATGRPVSPLLPHVNWVAALAFSPDGTVLATGDYSGSVHLWNVETGAMIGDPLSAGSIVRSMAFSPDGRLVAAGTTGPANHAVLWDLVTGRRRGDPVEIYDWVQHSGIQPGWRHAWPPPAGLGRSSSSTRPPYRFGADSAPTDRCVASRSAPMAG